MKTVLVYMKGYVKEAVLAPLFKFLEASFELMIPVVVASIVDVGIKNGDKKYILTMALIMAALGIVGLISSVTAQYFSAKAAVGFSTKLRYEFYKHIQGLSFSEIDTVGTSTLITRMTSDINQVQTGVNLVLRLLLRSPLVVFGAMIMAFTVDAGAALVFCVVVPALAVVVFLIMRLTIPMYKSVQSKLDRVLGRTRENLSGVRVIRAFGREKREMEEFNGINEDLSRSQNAVGRIATLMNPLTYVIVNGGTIALIYAGAIRVDGGIIEQGKVIALVNYMSQILVELVKMANLIITVNKSIACANRIADVLNTRSSMSFVPPDDTPVYHPASDVRQVPMSAPVYHPAFPAVEFDNVGFAYAGMGDEALSDVSFSAFKGDTVGIIGGIGSGKTTLVHLITRFYDVTSGSVRVDGRDVRDYAESELRDKIGIVMQKAVLFKGTIRDNIRWGKKDATDDEIYEALDAAAAREIVEKKEGKLDEMIEQGGKNLSGGQKQRLTIARALVKKPEILILDDSASALDYATEASLRKSIRELSYKPTVFIVSQRTSSIMHANLIIVLDDGKVAGMGTHEELLRECEVYREIYDSQYKREQ